MSRFLSVRINKRIIEFYWLEMLAEDRFQQAMLKIKIIITLTEISKEAIISSSFTRTYHTRTRRITNPPGQLSTWVLVARNVEFKINPLRIILWLKIKYLKWLGNIVEGWWNKLRNFVYEVLLITFLLLSNPLTCKESWTKSHTSKIIMVFTEGDGNCATPSNSKFSKPF